MYFLQIADSIYILSRVRHVCQAWTRDMSSFWQALMGGGSS